MRALPACDLEHTLCDVLALVQDYVVGPIGPRDRGFLCSAGSADDDSATRLDELREEETDAARDSVHEDVVVRLDVARLRGKDEGGEAL